MPASSELLKWIELEKAEALIARQNSITFPQTHTLQLSATDEGDYFMPATPTWSHGHQSRHQSHQSCQSGQVSPDNANATFDFSGHALYFTLDSRPITSNFESQSHSNLVSYTMPTLPNTSSSYTFNSSLPGERSSSVHVSDNSEGFQVPDTWELRAFNPSFMASSGSMTASDRDEYEKNCNAFRAELSIFLATVFNTQAEIAGISSIMTVYLHWIRTQTLTSSSVRMNFSQVFETLERRVREVHELAEKNHTEAWKRLMASIISIEGLVDKMKPIEEMMYRAAAERSQIFRENYDVRVKLSEQVKSP